MDKQEIKIDDAVVRKTIKCNSDFSCLLGDKGCLCDVSGFVGHELVEIKSNHSLLCQYHIIFGNNHYCQCPTRCELYYRYGM